MNNKIKKKKKCSQLKKKKIHLGQYGGPYLQIIALKRVRE
jgi:hypothetical protein